MSNVGDRADIGPTLHQVLIQPLFIRFSDVLQNTSSLFYITSYENRSRKSNFKLLSIFALFARVNDTFMIAGKIFAACLYEVHIISYYNDIVITMFHSFDAFFFQFLLDL